MFSVKLLYVYASHPSPKKALITLQITTAFSFFFSSRVKCPLSAQVGCGFLHGAEKLIWSQRNDDCHLDFLQMKRQTMGGSVTSFQTHKKVISIYSYNLDYGLY